jgi:hypothetical protein
LRYNEEKRIVEIDIDASGMGQDMMGVYKY